MLADRSSSELLSEFIHYLARLNPTIDRLPPLTELSQQLGISVASLREQLEVARALGLVEVRPRTGIRRLPYTFRPAVRQSLAYAMAVDHGAFEYFSDLRNNVEAAYWYKATALLTKEDHQTLQELVTRAVTRLHASPPQIPHQEHKELHLTIYRRLNNPFVMGILESYWEMYEAIGLNVFTDYSYLHKVWQYHQRMVDSICSGSFTAGYQALMEHKDLLFQRSQPVPSQTFE